MHTIVMDGFHEEMEKIAKLNIKQKLPWALARGLTGAASTVAIGLTMGKVLSDLKKKQNQAEQGKLRVSKIWNRKFLKKHPNLKKDIAKAEATMPLAAVGGGIGIAKGFSEKTLENAFKKMLKVI